MSKWFINLAGHKGVIIFKRIQKYPAANSQRVIKISDYPVANLWTAFFWRNVNNLSKIGGEKCVECKLNKCNFENCISDFIHM